MYILESSIVDLLPSPVLLARQTTATVTQTAEATTIATQTAQASSSCPGQYTGGTLAGAILGTFFGTLLLVYMFSIINMNTGTSKEEIIVEKRVRSGSRKKSRSGSYSSVRRPSAVYSPR